LVRPGEANWVTNEGIAAWDEAIEFMEKMKPVEAFGWDDRLAAAA